MEFIKNYTFFDNEDSINFFNFLLKKKITIDKITLLPCTKMKNRICIEVILNNYKTIICPVKTSYHWFSVTRQHVYDVSELTGNDVHEFSTEEKDFDKLFDFIWGNNSCINILDNIKKIQDKIKNIEKKLLQ